MSSWPAWAPSGATKALLLIGNVRLTRECLTHVLKSQLADFKVACVAHARQASESGVWPDVVLLNARAVRFADGGLDEDIAAIWAATHRAPVLILSEDGDQPEVTDSKDPGVAGVFPWSCGVSLLIAAINLVVAGGRFRAPPTGIYANSEHARNDRGQALTRRKGLSGGTDRGGKVGKAG